MLRGRLDRRFCEKKPKPPYVFRHPSQGNRRGDLPRLRKIEEITPRSKVREKKQRVRRYPASGGRLPAGRFSGGLVPFRWSELGRAAVSLPAPWFPLECLRRRSFRRNRYSTCAAKSQVWRNRLQGGAEFDTGRAGTAQTGSWVRRRKGEFRGSRRHTVTAAVGLRCCYLNLRHASMREQQRL